MSMRGRLAGGLNALAGFIAGPTGVQGGPQTPGRTGGTTGAPTLYGRTLYPSTAPPATRQTWELWKLRTESRNLSRVSPFLAAYLMWARVQALGNGRSRLHFPRLDSERTRRLSEAIKAIRGEWQAFLQMEYGSRGETITELAAHALHHRIVDGDCFVLPYRAGGMQRADFHPGDALAEQELFLARRQSPNRALGITYDARGKPVIYHFGHSGRYRPIGIWSISGEVDPVDVPARRVWHVRDRRGDGTSLRSEPVATPVMDDLARLTELDNAFVRAAVMRVAWGLLMQRRPEDTAGRLTVGSAGGMQTIHDLAGAQDGEQQEQRQPEFRRGLERSGEIAWLDDGYETANPFSPHPNADEAKQIERLVQRICAGLNISVMSLLKWYAGANFSSSQQATLQETEAIGELQTALIRNLHQPVWRRFFRARWYDWLRLPGVMPEDELALLYCEHVLRRPAIVEIHRVIPAIQKAVEGKIITWADGLAKMGFDTSDLESKAAEIDYWHERLGLAAANPAPVVDDGEDEADVDDEKEREKEEDEK